MTTVRLEEEDPVASPGGWHMTVRINQVGVSPGGSERILRSASYRFKQGAPNETDEQRGLRLGVKRNAKKRAMDSFNAETVEKRRAKRRRKGAVATALGAVPPSATPPIVAAGAGAVQGVLPPYGSPELMMARDVVTERDLLILRAFKNQATPSHVLRALGSSSLDDDEPWDEQRVIERHDFLRRSVRTTARLVGPDTVAQSMHDLVALCF